MFCSSTNMPAEYYSEYYVPRVSYILYAEILSPS